MSFADGPYLVIVGMIGIFAWLIMTNIVPVALDGIAPALDSNMNESLNDGWNKNVEFFDNSYAAIIIVAFIGSALLTFAIASHPILLVVWLSINVITLVVFEYADTLLQDIAASDMNTGEMDNAIDFFHSILPKLIPIANMLMALILLGKGVFR